MWKNFIWINAFEIILGEFLFVADKTFIKRLHYILWCYKMKSTVMIDHGYSIRFLQCRFPGTVLISRCTAHNYLCHRVSNHRTLSCVILTSESIHDFRCTAQKAQISVLLITNLLNSRWKLYLTLFRILNMGEIMFFCYPILHLFSYSVDISVNSIDTMLWLSCDQYAN